MIKIGITGSLASGKTTAGKILSYKRGPLFSADKAVKELYKKPKFRLLLSKKFKIINNSQLKKTLKKTILGNNNNMHKLEKIIHPLVRKEMKVFSLKNKNKRIIFYEIPLLIESKLMNQFDVIIFIRANRNIRLKRFKSKNGDEKLFNFLNKKQMEDKKKSKFCDHEVVNEMNLNILKKNLLAIIKKYE